VFSFDGWVLDSAASYASYPTHASVMEPLLRFGADGTSIEAGLAKEWTYDPEALTFTFKLQDGARFSNGDPVTAEDVAFSLGIWSAGPNFGLAFGAISDVTGEGDEVIMQLAYPDNTVMALLSSSVAGIMPKDFAGMTEDEFYSNPIGAGPFVVNEWSIGGRIVLTPNEFYYDPERPYVDELIIDVITSETERQILFESGEYHVVEYLSPTVAPQYDQSVLLVNEVHAIQHVGLNVLRPPFDDPLVRQAVAYALDYDAISAALGGYFEPPSGILTPNIANWAAPTKPYFRRDLTMARDLLAQSSAAGGAEVEMIFQSGDEPLKLISQIVQANLAEIGIDVVLSELEGAAFLDRAFSIDADMTPFSYGAVAPDMYDPLTWIMATGWLFSGYETDTLLGQFLGYAGAMTPEDQQAIVSEIQDSAIDNAPVIAVAEGSYLHAVDPALTGLESAPWGLFYYDTIRLGS
jgi:peptide/nickel transport system substrate-binding protein